MEALRLAARRASARLPSICRVVLFGSLASGVPTPRSDADLLIEVRDSPNPIPRDRVPEMLEALGPLPCPVDLFVMTSAERARAREEGATLARTALATGRDLL